MRQNGQALSKARTEPRPLEDGERSGVGQREKREGRLHEEGMILGEVSQIHK